MEYFLGSAVTFATLFLFGKLFQKKIRPVARTIRYSQSHIFELLLPMLPSNKDLRKPLESQATKHRSERMQRIMFIDEKAYWIDQNSLNVAEVAEGFIDYSTQKVVDTMAMDKVQLDKMIFIVDQLTEGKQNDRGNSGK